MDSLTPLQRARQTGQDIIIADAPPPLQGSYRALGREPESALRNYWRILRKRLWTILLILAVVLTATLLATLKMTRKYEAVSHIAISKESNSNLRMDDANENGSDFDYNIELDTQVSIIQSSSLALQVINDLNLASNPSFYAHAVSLPRTVTGQAQLDPTIEAALLTNWYAGLGVSKVPRTRMLEIRFVSPDPKLAAQIVNSLTSAYVERNFKAKYESTMQATDWLSRQLTDLQLKVETSEQALINYQRANGIVGIDEKHNITTSKLEDINKDLTSAEADRMQKQSVYQLAKSEPANLPSLANNALFSRLREQQTDLERQYAQLSTQFGPSYPKVIELNSQIKQTQSAIRAEIERNVERARIDYQTALSREKMLQAALDNQKREEDQLNEHSIEYSQLKRDADSNRTLYDSLNQKLKEASVTSGLHPSNVRLIDSARVPVTPSSPNIRRNLLLGLLLGLFGGIGAALLLEALDNTVRSPEQVEQIAAIPALGTIPLNLDPPPTKTEGQAITLRTHPNPRSAMSFISHARPRSKVAESYRALRTSILLSSIGRAPQVLMLTSALPQEGKTTTSINTAIVLAQKGGRVLLVDADMRRPAIHQLFGLKSHTGLSTILSGSSSFRDSVLPAPQVPNLDVLTAGPQPPNPAELLGSHIMRDFITQWRREYDFIVIDTPPVLSVTDAVLLSADMDSVILVVRSGKTTKEALRRARDLFDQVNIRVLGAVINAIDLHSPDAYYYGYSYAYGYSNKYYDESAEAPAV